MKYLLVLFFTILYEIDASCPNGTFPNAAKDKCYFIPKDSKPFLLAETSCQDQNGNLASISNIFDNMYLTANGTNLLGPNVTYAWLGGNNLNNGTWVWIDGQPFSYKNWVKGNPDNVAGDNCMAINLSDGLWFSKNCSDIIPYICELSQTNGQTTQPIVTQSTTLTQQRISSTSPSTTTITPVQFPQCYSYIPLGIDVSNDIGTNIYNKEIQFIISGVSQLYNPSIYSMYYANGFGDGQVDPTVYFINAPVSGLIYMVTQVLKHTTYSPSFLNLLSLMSNVYALDGYSNTTTMNTILIMGSTPNSTILNLTAPMIATLLNYGYGNNTIIGIALNSNVTSNDIKPWTDVGMKFLAWNDDIANLTLTLRGMMNCQEQMTSSSLSTQPISTTSTTNSITPIK